MVHNKTRNEIWITVPVNGSSVNNAILVYDYILGGWQVWDGPTPSCLSMMKREYQVDTGFYGSYSGMINVFGASYFGDNGAGITQLITTRYEHPEGQSSTKVFRRSYVNANSIKGTSSVFATYKFYRDYAGQSVVYGLTAAITNFQQRLNFGIPGKALSMELSHYSATDGLRIYGYSLEYRHLRST
jgi:hypothetical protein